MRLEIVVRRARAVGGDRLGAHGYDSYGAAFRDAGDQPSNRSLFISRGANRLSGETFNGNGDRKVDFVERGAQEVQRSEEHTSELQSRLHLVCRLLLEKKKKQSQSLYDKQQLLRET